MNNNELVSIVVPVFNEVESLEPLTFAIVKAMDESGLDYEIVYVDDGSSDGSRELLRELARKHAGRVRFLGFEKNCGQTAAFDAGFKAARGTVIVTLDADMQNDPADIPRLVEATAEWDVVCGYRAKRNDSIVRRISSRIANGFRNKLTHESVRDVGCSLRAMRAECVKGLKLYTGMHRFLPTLIKMDGYTITELPVNHYPRERGVSKYGIRNRLFCGLRDTFAVRWMQDRWLHYKIEEKTE
ncbi:MAG: glycosyltransferase family 2 protein [Candidatus Hydrogenedentes bacterium]|nr:glycosyltransferase family 2 protein [Candidatus Hydrogenedentota bacterium]